ncbi:chaplin [Streptomyces sp. DSM 44915]|uniref:Chaplin n=1 Tax=Streptomyces chisholmiae TaxID=3075540 RepID=A0ABU2JJQ0_9ACTN|nr:chaplin [Streptomyces sp. DSM 44915]MDT0265214.1 chaplin [Streptomyces sp. DSM 44915]
MNNLKKIGTVALLVGGIAAAGAGVASADSNAVGGAAGSPGVISGNNVQIPLDVPINISGNTVNIVGLLNPAFGNFAGNF